MNKSDLVQEGGRISGLTREVSETLGIRQRRARVGRNPKTGASVNVPPRKVPVFKMGKELQAILNPGAVPENAHP